MLRKNPKNSYSLLVKCILSNFLKLLLFVPGVRVYNDTNTVFFFLKASDKLGLESSGFEAGSAESLVPIILQGKNLRLISCNDIYQYF